jgi:hypothetical protein
MKVVLGHSGVHLSRFHAVIDLRGGDPAPAAQDEGNEKGETLARWLALGVQAPEPAIFLFT